MPKIKRDKADAYFSLWVRTRDKWTCQRCNKKYQPPTQALHCSHFFGRRKESTRFEPLNADAICMGCHLHFGANPAEHYDWQVKRKGQDVVDKLRLASNTYKKRERELEAIYWAKRLLDDYGLKV